MRSYFTPNKSLFSQYISVLQDLQNLGIGVQFMTLCGVWVLICSWWEIWSGLISWICGSGQLSARLPIPGSWLNLQHSDRCCYLSCNHRTRELPSSQCFAPDVLCIVRALWCPPPVSSTLRFSVVNAANVRFSPSARGLLYLFILRHSNICCIIVIVIIKAVPLFVAMAYFSTAGRFEVVVRQTVPFYCQFCVFVIVFTVFCRSSVWQPANPLRAVYHR